MFGHKKEMAALQQRNAALEREREVSQSNLIDIKNQLAHAEEEARRCRVELEGQRALFANFQSFGQSLADVQGSLSELAREMQGEKDRALQAQGVSIESRSAVERIAQNLSDLATKGGPPALPGRQ